MCRTVRNKTGGKGAWWTTVSLREDVGLASPQALFVLGPNGGRLLFLLIHLNFIQFKASSKILSVSFF